MVGMNNSYNRGQNIFLKGTTALNININRYSLYNFFFIYIYKVAIIILRSLDTLAALKFYSLIIFIKKIYLYIYIDI